MNDELIEFFRNDALIQPTIISERHDLKNGRWYRFEDSWKPSVTSFLNIIDKGIGFMMWLGNAISYEIAMKYANQRADLGSQIHTDIAHLILKDTVEIQERAEEEIKRLYGFMQFWKQYKPRPIAVECPMFCDELPFAGTVDLICEINNETWLIDWKTGQIWNDAKYQVSAYKYLAEKVFDIKIDKLVIIQLKEYRGNDIPTEKDKPKYCLKEIEPIPLEIIMNIYELWVRERKAEPKIPVEYPHTLTLEEKNDQKII